MRTPRTALLLLLTLGFGLFSLAGCSEDTTAPAASSNESAPGATTPGTSTPGTSTPGTSTPGASTPGTAAPADAEKASSEAGGASCEKADCACCKGDAACGKEDCACCRAKASAGEGPACLCAEGKAGTPVWCKKCDKGYVDGEEAHCEGCVKTAQKKLEDSGE